MMRSGSVRNNWLAGVALAVWLAAGAGAVFGQDLGEVARRERAQRAQQPQHADHVYTNDDFTRPQILLPQDQARFDASREAPSTPTPPPASAKTQPAKPARPSLMEAVRHYRWLKYIREQEQLNATRVLPEGPALAAPTRTPVAERPAVKLRSAPPPQPARAAHFLAGREMAVGVRVRRGDSLWKLAARFWGKGEEWRRIYAANPQLKNPHEIFPGEWLRLPEGASSGLSAKARVVKGDTLWKLARRHFGDGLAWGCIARANPQVTSPNRLYPGQELAIPAHCGSARASFASARPYGP